MHPVLRLAAPLLALLASLPATRPVDAQPVRIAIARLTHGHVGWILGRESKEDVQVVGIYEPDRALVQRMAKRYGFDTSLVHGELGAMLDAVKPEAVVAFGSIAEHLAVVEAAAPRGVHVMVEKPLAFRAEEAVRIEALARQHRVHVLTNYETTWYPSAYEAMSLVRSERIGPVRKIVVHDGHFGPKEIGVGEEFLSWLVDPEQNGGGALVDFGCYGANIATWLMRGAAPLTVTAITQHIKQDPIYARVDDEATIVLTYPGAQAIIQASWNWPDHRKDLEIYGERGSVFTPNARTVELRLRGQAESQRITPKALGLQYADPFAYLAAVVRGREVVADTDLSSLPNNVIVVRILDAARRSARTGETVKLERE